MYIIDLQGRRKIWLMLRNSFWLAFTRQSETVPLKDSPFQHLFLVGSLSMDSQRSLFGTVTVLPLFLLEVQASAWGRRPFQQLRPYNRPTDSRPTSGVTYPVADNMLQPPVSAPFLLEVKRQNSIRNNFTTNMVRRLIPKEERKIWNVRGVQGKRNWIRTSLPK